jgi:hypothetical protein
MVFADFHRRASSVKNSEGNILARSLKLIQFPRPWWERIKGRGHREREDECFRSVGKIYNRVNGWFWGERSSVKTDSYI